MGQLMAKDMMDAGLFSLVDYLGNEEKLEQLGGCIATRDQVKSVMLFSREGWRDLAGKRIGITDETATSVMLLRVLLEKKYGIRATFERLHAGVNDLRGYDAVLLIGDEALRRKSTGLRGFDLVYDLATEWYDWQKLPFVFAVWAVRKSLPGSEKDELGAALERSLASAEGEELPEAVAHGRKLGLSAPETDEYLRGFNFRLGEREREAIEVFRGLLGELRDADLARAREEGTWN
jgi:chorismate dehydratase